MLDSERVAKYIKIGQYLKEKADSFSNAVESFKSGEMSFEEFQKEYNKLIYNTYWDE